MELFSKSVSRKRGGKVKIRKEYVTIYKIKQF